MTSETPKPSLLFRSISIVSMPGFELAHGFRIDGLQPGLTVFHGPNGVGKSSLGRAMEWLIWPEPTPPFSMHLVAEVQIGEDVQTRTRLGTKLQASLRGEWVDPVLPGVGEEVQPRYRIRLRELQQENDPNQSFGTQFRRELLGGVNLGKIRAELQPKKRITTTANTTEVKAYKAAQDQVTEQRTKQNDKAGLESEILGFTEELAQEPERVRQKEALKVCLDSLDSAVKVLVLEEALLPFAEQEGPLSGLRETSAEKWAGLLAQREEARNQVQILQESLETAKNKLEDLGIAVEPDAADPIQAGRLLKALEDKGTALDEAKQGKIEASAKRETLEALTRWLGDASPEDCVLDARALDTAGDIATSLEVSRAILASLGTLDTHLKPEAAEMDSRDRNYGAILDLLNRWLGANEKVLAAAAFLESQATEPTGNTGARIWGFLILAILSATFGIGVLWKGTGWWATLAALALVGAGMLLPFRIHRTKVAEAPLPDVEGLKRTRLEIQDQATGLLEAQEVPGEWNLASVSNLGADLLRKQAAWLARSARERVQSFLESRRNQENDTFDGLAERARAIPGLDLDLGTLRNSEGFIGLMTRDLVRLQETAIAMAEVEATLQSAEEALLEAVREAKAFHARFKPGPDDRLEARMEELGKDLTRACDLMREIGVLEEEKGTLDKAVLEADQKVLEEAAAHGCGTEGDFEALLTLWEQWSPLAQAHQQALRDLQPITAKHPGWTVTQDLVCRTTAPLEARKATLEAALRGIHAQLEEADKALQRLQDIKIDKTHRERDLEDFIKNGDLGKAIVEKERASRDLENLRQRELQLLMHHLVLESQDALASTEDIPEVLRRASELFALFTGIYTLHFDPIKDVFYADDGARRFDLDTLSDGSRVQMLMAVRLAYVDAGETIQLPIILDETLATTDDHRTWDVIQAVLKLAETGRQIFYFTAQGDELSKWRTLGGGRIHEVDLHAKRFKTPTGYLAMAGDRWSPVRIEVPAGLDLQGFAESLEAGKPSIWRDLGTQHIWHAFAEGEQDWVVRFLSDRIQSIRQLQLALVRSQIPDDQRLLTTISALQAAQDWLRANREKPIDEAIFLAAKITGFSTTKMNNLLPALREAGGSLRAMFTRPFPKGIGSGEEIRKWGLGNGYLLEELLPIGDGLIEIREQFKEALPPGSPGWEAVQRFIEMAV